MAQKFDHESLMFRYLLGDLPESEHEQIEDGYFGDDEIFAQLQAAEDELVDRYVTNDLSPQERERFERKFLCSDRRRQKVDAARALLHITTTRPRSTVQFHQPERTSRWQTLLASLRGQKLLYGLSTAAILLALVSTGLVLETRRLGRQRDHSIAAQAELQQRVGDERERNRQLNEQHERDQNQLAQLRQEQSEMVTGAPVIPRFSLETSAARNAGGNNGDKVSKLIIPAKTNLVQLQVKIGQDGYPSYQAILSPIKNDGDRLWSQKRLKAYSAKSGEAVIDVWLPASIFNEEDYVLRLNGLTARGRLELIEEYPFTVVRR